MRTDAETRLQSMTDAALKAVSVPDAIDHARSQMRRFVIDRTSDLTNISGTGIILYGVEWLPGGPCDVYWLRTQTTGQYPSMDVVKSTHCYNNNAEVIYLD
jgi:hypothetical protein